MKNRTKLVACGLVIVLAAVTGSPQGVIRGVVVETPDDGILNLGSVPGNSRGGIGWNTAQTNDSLFIYPDTTSHNIIIADRDDAGTNFAVPNGTNPTVRMYNSAGTGYLQLDNSGTNGAARLHGSSSWGIEFISAASITFAVYANSVAMKSGAILAWSSTTSAAGTQDTFLSRQVAAVVQMGVDTATAVNQMFKGADSTGTDVTGGNMTLRAGDGTVGNAAGGHLVLAGGANAGTGEEGVVRLSDEGTKPTCAAGIRGAMWYDAGGVGAADTFEVCRKDAGDAYAWVAVF